MPASIKIVWNHRITLLQILDYLFFSWLFLTACAGVDTPVFIRKGVRFLRGLVKEKRENVVTVLTESSDEEKEIVIYGKGTQHYIMVEDILPSPRHIFLGTRVIAKHVLTGKYTFAKIDAIDGDKYSVTFEDKQATKGIVAVESIRNLYPPVFCGRFTVDAFDDVGKMANLA